MDDNKKQALVTTLKQIEKQFGKGAVMRLGDAGAILEVETVSTGSLSLDLALGIGGLPRGRVVEIYGPEASGKTTLTLHVAAEIQKKGGVAAFIDAEHALDSQYAEKLGVNIGELLLAQPGSGEEALEIADIFVRSGTVDLIVIDSVAALTPKAELEGDMGDSHMGLHARLMSQALRKLTANIKRSNTLVIFINQIRMKLGVTWGCFHYHTAVTLANGTTEKIGKIVHQQRPLEVLSYNRATQQFEPHPIVNWYDNGETNLFLQFTVGDELTTHQFTCTSNHLLLTPNGYQMAGKLNPGDQLITAKSFEISPLLEQLLWGTLLKNATSPPDPFPTVNGKHLLTDYPVWMVDSALPQEEVLATMLETAEATANYFPLLDRLQPLAVAIWYMGSGTFQKNSCSISGQGLPLTKQHALIQWFNQHGMFPQLNSSRIYFDAVETLKLHELIAPYIHPSKDSKLLPTHRGRFVPLEIRKQKILRAIPQPIRDIQLKFEKSHRFDLEIAGHHNYVVDGVVVHNSPETTTGGNALKFYASVRLDIRRTGPVKRGEEIIGNETRVKIVKNKLAPPLREVTFDIIYGEGISRMSELIELGVKHEIIDKSGTWYSYSGERLGQGKDAVRNYLTEHPEVMNKVEKQIREKALTKPPVSNSEASQEEDT